MVGARIIPGITRVSRSSRLALLISTTALTAAALPATATESDTRTDGPLATVVVVGTTPLPGAEVSKANIAAPVQTASAKDIERTHALDLGAFMSRTLGGVYVNEVQNNPLQPDVNYRGYTASPLLGTPQGLSVYLDGMRLNQPFGDVVSWDLIPRLAISTVTVMPGSNPLFGLNTLGGALAVQTKDGTPAPGTSIQATEGSDVRRSIEFEHARRKASGLHWYVTGNLYGEDGWREDSPSEVRQ